MLWVARLLPLAIILVLTCSTPALAQVGMLRGKVLDENGKPLKDAIILIERLGIRGNYKTKTNKNGEYIHAGLPLGRYKVSLQVNGKVVDIVNNVRVSIGEPAIVNFDLRQIAARRQAAQAAAATGQISEEMLRQLPPEERERLRRQIKERAEKLRKNKALNEAYNAGMMALQAGQYDAAIQAFKKAIEIDPEQPAVWIRLAEASVSLADRKGGSEREELLNQALQAYQKAMELQPANAGLWNNYGIALTKAGKIEEATQAFQKAAELDPTNAGKYYFNMGAVLTNMGRTEEAGEAFKKAIDTDPDYAPAYYQYGLYLVSKAQVGADGKIQALPGTREALEKYLELDPNGPYAQQAKALLATLSSEVQTKYEAPGAKRRRRR